MSAGEAFKVICFTCLNHLQANQPGVVRGEDPEYLHQARVALRRLQSGLDAFKRIAASEALDSHARALRQFTRALGPARDWDVFAGQTLAPVLEQFPGMQALPRSSGPALVCARTPMARPGVSSRRVAINASCSDSARCCKAIAWTPTQPPRMRESTRPRRSIDITGAC